MKHRTAAAASLLFGLALAACQDQATTPAPAPAPAREPLPQEPGAMVNRAPMEGYTQRGEIRTGYILDRAGRPIQVTYEVQGELAIWEGDIIIGRADQIATSAAQLRRPEGASYGVVIDGDSYRWPGGVVPYEISGSLTNQQRVTDAIAMVEQSTPGVTLVPRSGEADYVRFVEPADGCSSAIGRQGGMQEINLATNCSTGNAAHEILHALGMYHEHTREDRDNFVTILTANIESGKEHNFARNVDGATDIGSYDPGSMMHYGPYAFSIEPGVKKTIEAKSGVSEADMGQRAALGPTDIATIQQLYGANNAAPVAVIAALAASYLEGSPVSFNGGGSSDADDDESILTYSWDFGDGGTGSGANPSHTYTDNGSYTVTLTVSDGFASHGTSASVTIANVPPTVNAGADATRNEGSLFSQAGSFTDPGADSWTATVDYGEGAGAQPLTLSGKTFALSHTYVDNGSFTVTVQVTDEDGATGTDYVTLTVENVVPLVDAGADATTTSGETYAFSGSFSDPGVVDHVWNWSIDWDFGSPTIGSTSDQSAPIAATQQVCAAGTYSVNLSVTDKDGGIGSDALTLTVPYYAVTIDITPTESPNPVSLSNRGRLPVAILSTASFDAQDVDPATVMLGDGTGTDTPVAQRNNGTYFAQSEDVNGDGRMDLVVMFELPALRAGGEITSTTTQLVLRGFLDDACTNFSGTDAVTIVS